MIKVLLVDDHQLIRAGIKQLLESAQNIHIVAEAQCGEDALDIVFVKKEPIDIAVVDIEMPGIPVQELIQKLLQHQPPIRSVVLTGSNDESFPTQLLTNGAYSYVTKSCENEHLVRAIEKTMRNERYLSPDVAKRLAIKILHTPTNETEGESPFHRLSARETQCLRLLVHGRSVKEIAEALDINPKTINTYRYRIYQKLNITSDVDLIKLATRYKLIEET